MAIAHCTYMRKGQSCELKFKSPFEEIISSYPSFYVCPLVLQTGFCGANGVVLRARLCSDHLMQSARERNQMDRSTDLRNNGIM